ncbi:hypothetical protein TNCV_4066771 [Trichonephila clavipes]|uniref:Uncharacterized protein n=1 Tax=Trichonephila clavipes TaxID=2585209 RepID=A0A8X6W8Q4_TRICX|nr:hypothetical protein TNCV_4066771 [Trichonephila clavipes]
MVQQPMRAGSYNAHPNIPNHWALRCMNRFPDLVVCLKCLRPHASLVLIYRPNAAGKKGRVDLPEPVNRTQNLWCGSTIHYHSTLLGRPKYVFLKKMGGNVNNLRNLNVEESSAFAKEDFSVPQ